jgi:hypothetical protein
MPSQSGGNAASCREWALQCKTRLPTARQELQNLGRKERLNGLDCPIAAHRAVGPQELAFELSGEGIDDPRKAKQSGNRKRTGNQESD